MNKAALIDLDGCLVNSLWSQTYVPIAEFDAEAFNERIPDFPLNTLIHNLLISLEESGYNLYFLTARQKFMYPNTKEWLQKLGWGDVPLVMRPEGDIRPDVEYKLDTYRKMKDYGVRAEFIIDDKMEIIQAFWEQEKIPGFCFVGGFSEHGSKKSFQSK